jgi:cellulose synthase/poly-beta-1,6-N-acetylglucosamine synthase-like glycosyltransferase
MVYYFTPFIKNNLGEAYNHYCNLVPEDDDWITFIDGDVMQLHTNWGDIWHKIIHENDDAGIISCLTNRITKSNIDQLCHNMYDETDILKHKAYAIKIFNENQYSVKEMKNSFLSGFFFAFKKSTWKQVNGFENGILHVDKQFYRKVKKIKRCFIATGFYVLHYYRLLEGHTYKDHLL